MTLYVRKWFLICSVEALSGPVQTDNSEKFSVPASISNTASSPPALFFPFGNSGAGTNSIESTASSSVVLNLDSASINQSESILNLDKYEHSKVRQGQVNTIQQILVGPPTNAIEESSLE